MFHVCRRAKRNGKIFLTSIDINLPVNIFEISNLGCYSWIGNVRVVEFPTMLTLLCWPRRIADFYSVRQDLSIISIVHDTLWIAFAFEWYCQCDSESIKWISILMSSYNMMYKQTSYNLYIIHWTNHCIIPSSTHLFRFVQYLVKYSMCIVLQLFMQFLHLVIEGYFAIFSIVLYIESVLRVRCCRRIACI